MFTSFGVGAKSENTKKQHHEDESHHEQEIDVEIHDEHDHDTDTGQIAVDILDCPNSIIIIAPVA